MSWWTRVGVTIQDLECFKAMCKNHNVKYEANEDEHFKQGNSPVVAILTDMNKNAQQQRRNAFLIREGGAIKLMWDNDPNYASLSARLGQNGGKLKRDYTKSMIETGVKRSGAMVNSCNELADGSLVLKVSSL